MIKRNLFFVLPVLLSSCKVTQKQEVGGEAVAKVVIEFPQADRCFTDPRIETYEELKECLELVTNNQWSVDVNGQIVPGLGSILPVDDTVKSSEE